MPKIILGLPLIGALSRHGKMDLRNAMMWALEAGVGGFDTSDAYGRSEEYIGDAVKKMEREGIAKREDVFITSKICNGPQEYGDIERDVDMSLKRLRTDYLDVMLLHWPYGPYVENWGKLLSAYKKGKIRAIGIANAKVRHLEKLRQVFPDDMPQVLQTEIHPFNTCVDERHYCNKFGISMQSCTSLCQMIGLVTKNTYISGLSEKYKKPKALIMLKWCIQNGISPVFRSFSQSHILEMRQLDDFSLSDEEMRRLETLNIDYRYHPESLNCPGF